eukprot:CAMPEP_0195294426 /NCGR_PEP_ID=MMETSP0707-20130614/14955_1 /TAXON_ID=33640 /ORGANISM="Asterionellopsis glacialis, Strain CCMP134" /LENGTH=347 /DNA_ID=CAMNT_0040355399 /DNA_START=563 /DNA_END=1603 /DNA_ORIENTATION=-
MTLTSAAASAAAAVSSSSSSSCSRRTAASALKWAAGGWTFFIVENVVLSENRSWLIDTLGGEERYHGCYGVLSTGAMISVGYAFFRKLPLHSSTSTSIPHVLRPSRVGASLAFTSTGLIMASQAFPKLQIPLAYEYGTEDSNGASSNGDSTTTSTTTTTTTNSSRTTTGPLPPPSLPSSTTGSWKVKCPFDFTDSKLKGNNDNDNAAPYGLERISRHPGLWSMAFMCAGQAMLAPTLPYQVWWSMPTLVAWIGGSHTDSRYRRGMGGTMDPLYDQQTSNIPFYALLTGKQSQQSQPQGQPTPQDGGVMETIKKFLTEECKPLNAVLATMVATMFVMKRKTRINTQLW